jgi:hypothetical protein
MSQNLEPIRSFPPLNIGNVITVGITLYRSHLRSYLNIALTAFLWYAPTFLIFVPFQIFAINAQVGGGFSPSLFLLLPVAIALLIYGGAKYCFNAALIARLAFQELINQPETVALGRSQLKSHPWGFFWIAMRIGAILVGIYLLLALAGGIAASIVTIGLAALGQPYVLYVALAIIVLLILAVLTWFISRWIVAELPLATGEVDLPGRSIDRSWELTASSVFRVQGVVSLAFLVTLPLLAVLNYIPQLFLIRLEPGSTTYWIVYSVLNLLSFAVGIITLPFWQTVKAVLYYDLRNRREGLGLQLADRPRSQP